MRDNYDYSLFCIGNALADVFASVNEEFLIRHGLRGPASHIEMEKLTGILDALPDSLQAAAGSGGGAANVAKIAGFLGTKVCFSGAIGVGANGGQPDKYGEIFKKDLAAAGVDLKLQLASRPTGICLYLKADETRVVASPSAALDFSEKDISADDIRKSRVVVIDGFMMGRELVGRILDLCRESGTVAAIDLASASIAFEHAEKIMDYANRNSLILFMNEAEASAFYKKTKNKEPIPNEANLFFESLTAGKSFPIIVVKLGPRGALCFSGGKTYRAETQAVEPKDSAGAGDAFCAGFLSAWVREKPLSECAEMGNMTAGLVLNVKGTQAEGNHFTDLAARLKQK